MLLSVRSPTERVPTWVGCRRMSGGSLRVNLGSQRVARAVVSWLATVSGEDALLEDAVASRDGMGREEASARDAGGLWSRRTERTDGRLYATVEVEARELSGSWLRYGRESSLMFDVRSIGRA